MNQAGAVYTVTYSLFLSESSAEEASYIKTLHNSVPSATYDMVEEEGPPHDKSFVFSVNVNGHEYTGQGKTKKAAKQAAAGAALKDMDMIVGGPPEVDNGDQGDFFFFFFPKRQPHTKQKKGNTAGRVGPKETDYSA